MDGTASLPLSQISDLFSDPSSHDDVLQVSSKAPPVEFPAYATAPYGVFSHELDFNGFLNYFDGNVLDGPIADQASSDTKVGSDPGFSNVSNERNQSKPSRQVKQLNEADAKREARLARKRLSGKKARERQKNELLEAEQQVQQLMNELNRLQMEHNTLESKKEALSTVLRRYDRVTGQDSSTSLYDDPTNNDSNSKVGLSGRDTLQRIISTEAPDKTGPLDLESFIRVWKKILFEGSRLICSADAHNDDAVRALPAFVNEVHEWYGEWTLSVDDATFMQLLTTNMETGALTASNKEHWMTVAQSLHLTADQKKHAWHACAEVFRFVEKARQEHADATDGLQRLVAVIHEQPTPAAGESAAKESKCKAMAALTAELLQVFNKSKDNWQRRARLATDLADAFMFKNVLTPRQSLIAALNSFPFMLDSVSLLSGLASALRFEFGDHH